MRYLSLTVISIISVLILQINLELHIKNESRQEKTKDIILQLNFLESELKNDDLGQRMQQLFPEGFVFIHALYGLTWCELAASVPQNELKLREKAITESLNAYNEINTDWAKQTFDHDLEPHYGIFYCGWKNYLLSELLMIDTTFQGHEKYLYDFKSRSDSISDALLASDSPYLRSYRFQAWPADMFVAMASLSNYDRIFKPKYQDEITQWIKKVKQRLDPATKMIPHEVDVRTGKPVQGARGSSMSLMLKMLDKIDPQFAKKQFDLFKTNFVSTTFGLPSIREYPKGQHGRGDIDSGPVLFGVGFAATIDAIGMPSDLDSNPLSNRLYKTVNAFGFALKSKKEKKYLFGKLPMADAFIAWGRAAHLNDNSHVNKNDSRYWRLKFHLLSILILAIIWMYFFRKRIKSFLIKNTGFHSTK